MKTINIKQKTPKVVKAIKGVTKKVGSKVMGIDLIDGQKRGESIARRLFLLLVIALFIYFLLLTFIGKKEEIQVQVPKEEAYAKEVVPDVVENINGDVVTTKVNGEVSIVPAEVFMESSSIAVKRFTQSYRGSRIDDKYFALLDKYCSDEVLKTVVAISVAETGMGRDVKRQSNFFGWFKGGNRNYDPDQETMAKDICNGVEKNYIGIGSDKAKAKKYVGYISNAWLENYRWAYAQMESR